MEILINNKAVVLPEDFSMSYDIENRFFSVKSEGWSLDFNLPLRGCPRNISIFGAVHHKNIKLSTLTYSCVIRHGAFDQRGIAVPISVNETSISLQFLSGRSEVNYVSPLESTYIRNISLPQTLVKSEVACLANAQHDIDDGRTELCLPWVNNHTGNIQNHLDLTQPYHPAAGQDFYYFDSDVTEVSCQIYLVELTRRIIVQCGYSVDLTAWYNSPWKYLLVWNAVPAAWGQHNFNIALPKWTVMEFIEQIELLTGFDFDINEYSKKITVRTSSDVVASAGTVKLENIEEAFEMEIGDNSLDFREGVELKYADRGDKEWSYESCKTAIDRMEDDEFLDDTPVSYNNWALPSGQNALTTQDCHVLDTAIQFISERGRYFKRKVYDVTSQSGTDGQGNPTTIFNYWTGFMFMNQFGETSSDEDAKFKELKIVPARIIHTVDNSARVFGYSWDYVAMDPGEYEANESTEPTTIEEAVAFKDRVDKYIEREEDAVEYLNLLYVTFWKKEFAYTAKDGSNQPYSLNQNAAQFGIRDRQQTSEHGERYMFHYMGTGGARYWSNLKFYANMTLSLRAPEHQSACLKPVDGTHKYTFKWLSKTIPDVKSMFVINGRRFYCSVIKTNWTIDGMSEELEGEFYEII